MKNAPSQKDLKILVSDLLKHGDQAVIANILGVTPGHLSRRLNPADEECKLYLVEGLREAWAIKGANPEAFRALRSYIEILFDAWEKPGSALESLPCLVIAADKEADDVIRSFVAGKPVHEQLAEVAEAMAALSRVGDALRKRAEIRREAV